MNEFMNGPSLTLRLLCNSDGCCGREFNIAAGIVPYGLAGPQVIWRFLLKTASSAGSAIRGRALGRLLPVLSVVAP
jgi:hypothetical protein